MITNRTTINIQTSSIYIVNDVESYTKELVSKLPLHSTRVIQNKEDKDTFLIAHAKMALKEAYISVNETKYILLGASRFSIDAQNSLLKVLEEPPKNIIFVIITNSKTTILPTIFSRLLYNYLKIKENITNCTLDITHFDLKTMYLFLKENQRISKQELKVLLQSMMYQVKNNKIRLNKTQLDSFTTSIKLCDLNSRPINILSTLLLNLMDKNDTIQNKFK
jgi:DNA polymerase-3 subunit delta'